MTSVYDQQGVAIHHGDALDVLRTLPDSSVDAVVTDPPYGLEFMGKEWDSFKTGDGFRRSRNDNDAGRDNAFGRTSRTSPEYIAGSPFQQWCQQWATECFRVLKPGGHMLAFGGTRTYHRLTCGIEDAGFEIRDSLHWIYGSGFPKSLDVSKAIDKAAGATRSRYSRAAFGGTFSDDGGTTYGTALSNESVTDDARRWSGYGTALKPAHEPIVVARKPLAGTVAGNVLEYGTGALNIDGCRVAHDEPAGKPAVGQGGARSGGIMSDHRPSVRVRETTAASTAGRWPANVVLDDVAAAELDRQSGTSKSPGTYERSTTVENLVYGASNARPMQYGHGDSGGASRFFPTFRYQAKADAAERPVVNGARHSTVKPLALMRWLVRLVTPPGGTVLEPFAGSGTTVEACLMEGFGCIAIEREADYIPLIRQRVDKHRDPAAYLESRGEAEGTLFGFAEEAS